MKEKMENELKEYDLLGFRLKVREEVAEGKINPSEVIQLVQTKIRDINEKASHLSDTEKMIMVALELAELNLQNQTEFKKDITRLQNCAKDALSYINDISAIS